MLNTEKHRAETLLDFGLSHQAIHARQEETRHNDTRSSQGDEADLLLQMGILVPRD